MSTVDFEKLFNGFSNIKIGVLGDVMLDTYWWGHVERISPEAPVPIVSLDKKEYRIGGAGNVAWNLACLGAQVSVISIIGKDEQGSTLADLFSANNINTDYLLQNESRITTSKSRIISRNQQMMRLDSEITTDLSSADENLLLQKVEEYLSTQKPSALILEDYNKGVLTENVITNVIALCKKYGVITTVDPKRKNFLTYKGVDIFKPNMKEVKEGLNLLIDEINPAILKNIHVQLHNILKHGISFITLSERGVYYQDGSNGRIVPSHVRNIADVSGAVRHCNCSCFFNIRFYKKCFLNGRGCKYCRGLVCEEVGTVAIKKDRLLEECKLLLV